MNTTKKNITGIAAIILSCILLIGTAGAYDVNTACESAKEIITATNNITALELVAFYSDYTHHQFSLRQFKISTEYVLNPEDSVCGQIQSYLEGEYIEEEPSEMILTTVAGEERISYKLSPETSRFVKLPELVDFPDPKKYADKMLLIFRITGDSGKIPMNNDASPLNPENIFKSRNRITPSAILADLIGTGGTKTSASSLLTTAVLESGSLQAVGDVHSARVPDFVADRQTVQAGQGDFASTGSDLIRKYRQG
jgi:hypothetical protein